jgi:hypothetical protein
MTRGRFYTDEDVYRAVATQLQARGGDAVSAVESGQMGRSDQEQIEYATREGRVLVTFNVGDFARLHHEWLAADKEHAGLAVSAQRPIGQVLRRLEHLAQTLTAEEMRGHLEYLSKW